MNERPPSAALRRVVARARRPAVPLREAGWVNAMLADVIHPRGEDGPSMQSAAQEAPPTAARIQRSSEPTTKRIAEGSSSQSTIGATTSGGPTNPAPAVSPPASRPLAPSTVSLVAAAAVETMSAPESRPSAASDVGEHEHRAVAGPSTTRATNEGIANVAVAAEADTVSVPATVFVGPKTIPRDDLESPRGAATVPSAAGNATVAPGRGWQVLDRGVAVRAGPLETDRGDQMEPSPDRLAIAVAMVQGEARARSEVHEVGSNVAGSARRQALTADPAHAPAPPQIFIDRIEVVSTAAAVEPDPFGSLAMLRRGVARQPGGGR